MPAITYTSQALEHTAQTNELSADLPDRPREYVEQCRYAMRNEPITGQNRIDAERLRTEIVEYPHYLSASQKRLGNEIRLARDAEAAHRRLHQCIAVVRRDAPLHRHLNVTAALAVDPRARR